MSTGKRLNRRSIGPLLANTSLTIGEVDLADDVDGIVPLGQQSAGATGDSGLRTGRQPVISVNDDYAERLQMRRHRIQQQNALSPSRDRTNRQPAAAGGVAPPSSASILSGLSTSQLAEHYSNCIKLSSENKITMKNAFGLHLIDCMAEMIKNKDPEMSNFQVASCTLDASAKIYGYRVDCVHAETQKIALGLGRSAAKNKKRLNDEESDENSGVDGENGVPADQDTSHRKNKRKKVNQKSTIEKNLNHLNCNKFDVLFEVDPLFRKTTELFSDGGGGGSVLLGSLRCRNDGCELILDSLDPLTSKGTEDDVQNQTRDSLVDITQFAAIFKKIASGVSKICPPFTNFEFNSWKPEDSNYLTGGLQMESNWNLPNVMQHAYINRLDSAEPQQGENDYDFDGRDGQDDGVELDHEDSVDENVRKSADHMARPPIPEIFIEQPTTERREAASLMDLTRALAIEPNEYSYFKKDFASAWAGPKHWHVRPLSKGIPTVSGTVEPKPRLKKPPFRLVYSMDLRDEFQFAFMPSGGKMHLSSETRRKWSYDNTTLIEDVSYRVETLQQLFLKPFVKIRQKMAVNQSADAELQAYDYENRNDVENFCPAAGVDLNEPLSNFSGSDDAGSPAASSRCFAESQFDVDTQFVDSQIVRVTQQPAVMAFVGDNLVQQPRKVAVFEVPYMRTARRINVRHLKQSIWKVLTDGSRQQISLPEAEEPMRTPTPEAVDTTTEQSFCEVYRRLPKILSSENAANLTFAMAFACTLHLANEKNLVLTGHKDMKDFSIRLRNEENVSCHEPSY